MEPLGLNPDSVTIEPEFWMAILYKLLITLLSLFTLLFCLLCPKIDVPQGEEFFSHVFTAVSSVHVLMHAAGTQ